MLHTSLVAVILALGVAITLIVLAVSEFSHGTHVTAEESTLLSTTLGAAVGAIAAYLGISRNE